MSLVPHSSPLSHAPSSPVALPPSSSPTPAGTSEAKSTVLKAGPSDDLTKVATNIFGTLKTIPTSFNSTRGTAWLNRLNQGVEEIDLLCNRILEGNSSVLTIKILDQTVQDLSLKLQKIKNGIMATIKSHHGETVDALLKRLDEIDAKIIKTHSFKELYLAHANLQTQLMHDMGAWGAEWETLKGSDLIDYSLPAYQKVLADIEILIDFQNKVRLSPHDEKAAWLNESTQALHQIATAHKRFSATFTSHLQRNLVEE